MSFQNAAAKKTSAENKAAQTRQEILTVSIEQNATIQDYTEKMSKIEGERFQSMGQIEGSDGEIAKLQNQVANYKARQGLYFILASQDGQIVQINKAGIGEILKDGENIATIVPDKVDYAVEMYIKPVDLPLIKQGQRVMCFFDGFPAIVFSGWPNSSYGTFAGRIIAVENNISANGLFKALVVEDKNEKLAENAERLGQIFRSEIQKMLPKYPLLKLVRGKGLLNAIVVNDTEHSDTAWNICVRLAENGLLAKPTHGNIIRFAPPLVMTEEQLRDCVSIIINTLKEFEK